MCKQPKLCLECGKPLTVDRKGPGPRQSKFCSKDCGKAHSNRRMKRGAELYDVVMTWRFQRDDQPEKVWDYLRLLASAYRDSDKTLRDGRKSWMDHRDWNMPIAYTQIGDGR